MHELSIVEGILETVVPEVRKYNVTRITEIRLKIGEMSGIVPQCIDEYFGIAAKGTIAEGARIRIERIPVRVSCPECGYEGGIARGRYKCPGCGGTGFRIVSGREYYIDSVEAD